jgi:hypothetical protein
MKPEDCGKYEACNANVCPLNEQWRRSTQLPGEPICFWFREYSKNGGPALVLSRCAQEMADTMATAYADIMDDTHMVISPYDTALAGTPGGQLRWGHQLIRRYLKRWAHTGSKFAQGARLPHGDTL